MRREDAAGRPRVVVDVMAPEHFEVDLFAEGPTPDWALPLPAAMPGAPAGERRFTFDLDGLPPGAKADGAALDADRGRPAPSASRSKPHLD